jgi:sec-independent protein translocase protein TatA
METVSLSHWLVVLVVVLILFGEARVPSAIGDLARGTRAFRAGMKDGKIDETGGETLIKAHPADRSPRRLRTPQTLHDAFRMKWPRAPAASAERPRVPAPLAVRRSRHDDAG